MHNWKRFFSIVLFLAAFNLFLSNALSVKAMTAAEIQALISQLQSQIAQLQKQLAATREQPAAWCHDFNTNLKFGDSSPELSALKTALTKEGFSGFEAMSGVYEFDEQIASAIVAFQEKYKSEILTPSGLKNGTGFAGQATRKKLNSLYGCGVKTPPSPAPVTAPVTSSITLLSLNNGESLLANTIHTVTISVPQGNKKEIGFVLYDDSIRLGSLIGSRLTETIFNWTVGQYQDQNGNKFVALDGQKYRIALVAPGQNEPVDFSDNDFSIIPITALNSSLTVSSPNGGEKWIKGGTYKINWVAIDPVNMDNVDIFLTNQTSIPWKLIDIVRGLPISSGSYSWTIPADDTFSPGNNYKILMTSKLKGAATGNIGLTDQSNYHFSIVSESGLKEAENQLANISSAIFKLSAEINQLFGR